MYKQCFFAVPMISLAIFSYVAFAQDNSHRQLLVSVKLIEQTTKASQAKTLTAPTMAVLVGRPFSFNCGGNVKPKVGDGDLEIGTHVTGELEYTGNDMIQLALKIRVADLVFHEDDNKTDVVRAETLEIRTILQPGVTKRLNCSKSQWCEVRVEEVQHAPLAHGDAKLGVGDILTVTFTDNEAYMLRDEQAGKQSGLLKPPLYRLAAKVVGCRPNGVCVIESHQKTKCDDVLHEMSLTGLVRAASVSAERTVPVAQVANLKIEVREIKPDN